MSSIVHSLCPFSQTILPAVQPQRRLQQTKDRIPNLHRFLAKENVQRRWMAIHDFSQDGHEFVTINTRFLDDSWYPLFKLLNQFELPCLIVFVAQICLTKESGLRIEYPEN